MSELVFSIAKRFSVSPGGRTPDDGEYSGQELREQYLIPLLERGIPITLDFDDTYGYGSSFLEEAFGGLIRAGYTKQEINSVFSYHSSTESIIQEIQRYIDLSVIRESLIE